MKSWAKSGKRQPHNEVVLWEGIRTVLLDLIEEESPAAHLSKSKTKVCFLIHSMETKFAFCSPIPVLNKAIKELPPGFPRMQSDSMRSLTFHVNLRGHVCSDTESTCTSFVRPTRFQYPWPCIFRHSYVYILTFLSFHYVQSAAPLMKVSSVP